MSARDADEMMPTYEEPLRAMLGLQRVYLFKAKSRSKDYECKECDGLIPQGAQHAVLRYLHKSKRSKTSHHHVHHHCARDKILPQLTSVEHIPYEHAPLRV